VAAKYNRTDREEEEMSPPSNIVSKKLLFHSYSFVFVCGRVDDALSVVAAASPMVVPGEEEGGSFHRWQTQ